jgi:hypothetical protein
MTVSGSTWTSRVDAKRWALRHQARREYEARTWVLGVDTCDQGGGLKGEVPVGVDTRAIGHVSVDEALTRLRELGRVAVRAAHAGNVDVTG